MSIFDALSPSRRQYKQELARIKTELVKLDKIAKNDSGFQTIGGYRPGHLEHSIYENAFPYVRPQIDIAKTAKPYIEDINDDRFDIDTIAATKALLSPSVDMDYLSFVDFALSSFLTQEEVAIRVHFDGKQPDLDNVYGYTFLPNCARERRGGINYYNVVTEGGQYQLNESEVMLLRYSRLPEDIDRGFSPGTAIRKWASVDDYVADYERGFMENGAFLGVIIGIPAISDTDFASQMESLEKDLRGAKNANKITYVKKPLNVDGTTSTIDFQVVQATNKDMDLSSMNSMVSKHMQNDFGTPSTFFGDDTSAKFDNADVTKSNFIEWRVNPILDNFWGQFSHELSRICGVRGLNIKARVEPPELADKKLVEAQTMTTLVAQWLALVQAGAEPYSASRAMGLSDKFIVVGREIQNAPKPEPATTVVATQSAPAPRLEQHTHYHSEKNDALNVAQYNPTFTESESDERQLYNAIMRETRKLNTDDGIFDEAALVAVIFSVVKKHYEAAGVKTARSIAQKTTEKIATQFVVGEQITTDMKMRIADLVAGYAQEAKNTVAAVTANPQGLTAAEIKKQVDASLPAYRAEMIARNEVINGEREGALQSAKDIANTYGIKINKVWVTEPDACEICSALDGRVVGTEDKFFNNNEILPGGIQLVNDYASGETPDAHVNCRCSFKFEVE